MNLEIQSLVENKEETEAHLEVLKDGHAELEASIVGLGESLGSSEAMDEMKQKIDTMQAELEKTMSGVHEVKDRADHAVSLAEAATAVGEGQVSAAETVSKLEEVKERVEHCEKYQHDTMAEQLTAVEDRAELMQTVVTNIARIDACEAGVKEIEEIASTVAGQGEMLQELSSTVSGFSEDLADLSVMKKEISGLSSEEKTFSKIVQGVSKDVAAVMQQTEALKSTLPAIQTSINTVEERAEHAVHLAEAATSVGEGQVSAAETVACVEEMKTKVESLEEICKGQLSQLEEVSKGQLEAVKALSQKIVENKSSLGALSTHMEAIRSDHTELKNELEGVCEGSAGEITKLHSTIKDVITQVESLKGASDGSADDDLTVKVEAVKVQITTLEKEACRIEALDGLWDKARETSKNLTSLEETTKSSMDELEAKVTHVQEELEGVEELAGKVHELEEGMEELSESVQLSASAMEELEEVVNSLQDPGPSED